MNNKYEQTQEKNPNRFSVNQHFIPVESIKKFCNEDNEVLLTNLNSKNRKTVSLKPTDEIFTVKRLWNQKEERLMKFIEDAFQNSVDKIINNQAYIFNKDENMAISRMYALWEARIDSIEHFKNELKEEIFISINSEGTKLTKIEQENLEKNNYLYIDADNGFPTRHYFNLRIQLFLQRRIEEYKNISWGILFTNCSSFIMPSNPIYKTLEIIFPISPDTCLVPKCVYEDITKEDVEYFNQLMIENAKWFYFTRNKK